MKDVTEEVPEDVTEVSNPWREAIEARRKSMKVYRYESFQSLEGGY